MLIQSIAVYKKEKKRTQHHSINYNPNLNLLILYFTDIQFLSLALKELSF